jgi:TRAP-type C4-dicarboxylate transport system permease small subunit
MDRLFRFIQRLEALLIGYGMILIAVLTIANVLSRSLLGESLAFVEELSQFLIVFITFIGLSYGASQGRHIRMTALYDQLSKRPRKVLMVVIAATTALLMFLLAYYALTYIETVHVLGTESPALGVPLWAVYVSAPVGFVLAGIQYALTVARNLRSPGVYISYDHTDEYEEADSGV